MAKEYIEREAAVDALNKALFFYEDETEARFKNDPDLDISEWFFHRIFVQHMNEKDRQTVLDIPAADVAPVKHGKWLKRDDMPRIVECKCSVCGYADYPSKSDRYWFERNYCPNCGAKMEVSDD